MKILKTIDSNTRIIQKRRWMDGWQVEYQVKKWHGYETIYSLYSYQYDTIKGYEGYFKYCINRDLRSIGKNSQF